MWRVMFIYFRFRNPGYYGNGVYVDEKNWPNLKKCVKADDYTDY